MKYKSTRGKGTPVTGAKAVIKGIADDGGLFVPTEIPELPISIEEMKGMKYQEIAKLVIGSFFDDYTEDELVKCIRGAYEDNFDAEDVVPVIKAGDAHFIELYHGRTSAFKDMALSILPYLLTTAVKKEKEESKICILTATSGDTGKAALAGFSDVDGTEIIVFFPEDGVSEVQKQQMITQTGNNTHVFAIKGNFDDAQTGVKKIFGDREFASKIAESGAKFSSANSINIGRLVPQVAYYVYSYVKLLEREEIEPGEKINIVVPTGNFGNILAAYYAKAMGIPVNRFICASNENKVLTDFIRTGTYDIRREFHITNSPSMDILISSNLERLLYHMSGCDGEGVEALMRDLEEKKVYTVNNHIKEAMKDFYGGFADMEMTNETIADMYRKNRYLMDTHTAVAYSVYEDYRKETGDDTVTLIASTASAYKFAESVSKSIGLKEETNGFHYIESLSKETGIKVPDGLKNLDKKEVRHKGVIEISEMKEVILKSLQ